MTSPSWEPERTASQDFLPDPNALIMRAISPEGTDPRTAARSYFWYHLSAEETETLHTSAIGSFPLAITADEIDLKGCRATLNIWMYNEMSETSLGRFAWLFGDRPMAPQFMWWNWKVVVEFDSKGNVTNLPASSSGGGSSGGSSSGGWWW